VVKTGWIPVRLTFRDKITGMPRVEDAVVEVVSMGGPENNPQVLFQDEGGYHRVIAARDIIKMEV
jgi:hypothetical protein